jgi:hypothetical protein
VTKEFPAFFSDFNSFDLLNHSKLYFENFLNQFSNLCTLKKKTLKGKHNHSCLTLFVVAHFDTHEREIKGMRMVVFGREPHKCHHTRRTQNERAREGGREKHSKRHLSRNYLAVCSSFGFICEQRARSVPYNISLRGLMKYVQSCFAPECTTAGWPRANLTRA